MKKLAVIFFVIFALTIKAQTLIPSDNFPKKLKKGDVEKLKLKETTLKNPWTCLNYNEAKDEYNVSTLPVGTIILVDSTFTVFFKKNCGNRLLSLETETNQGNESGPSQYQASLADRMLTVKLQQEELTQRARERADNYNQYQLEPICIGNYYYTCMGGYMYYCPVNLYAGWNRSVWVRFGVSSFSDRTSYTGSYNSNPVRTGRETIAGRNAGDGNRNMSPSRSVFPNRIVSSSRTVNTGNQIRTGNSVNVKRTASAGRSAGDGNRTASAGRNAGSGERSGGNSYHVGRK